MNPIEYLAYSSFFHPPFSSHALIHNATLQAWNIIWIDSSHLEDETVSSSPIQFHTWCDICAADAILVPGIFGERGTEGMIKEIS